MGEVSHLTKIAIQESRSEVNEARDRMLEQAGYHYDAADLAVDSVFYIAQRPYRVNAIRAVPVIAGTDVGAVTAQIRKLTGTQAPSAGVLLHTGTFDLKGTINTVVSLTLTATAADLELAAGDRIAFDLTGLSTAAVGYVAVDLIPI